MRRHMAEARVSHYYASLDERKDSAARRSTETVGGTSTRRVRTAFPGHLPARVIHQQPSHDPRRYSEKMRAIVPRHPAETAQPKVRLVHQGGRLQRMPRPLRTEMARRNGPEFRINERQEPLERPVIPLLPSPENLGDFVDSLMIQVGV